MNGFAQRAAGFRPSAIREILKVTETPEVISFAGGLPAPDLFPTEEIAAAAAAVLAEDGAAALQYGPTEGFVPLRRWVAGHVEETVQLRSDPEDILVTSGSQQGLDLLAKVMLDPGDVVLTENPAYLGALQAFRSYEARPVGLASDGEGLIPDALRSWLRESPVRAKFLYLISNFQNPTGHQLSPGRRREIASIAGEHGLLIVEDDPYGLLRFEGEPVPALASHPGAESAVYLGTASKMLAPGLRVAWMVVRNRALRDRLIVAKQGCDLHTSSYTQRIVAQFVARPGLLDRHLARLREVYRERRDAMLAALASALPKGARWSRPAGGLFLWARLPQGVDTTELLRKSVRRGVAFVPGEPFWIGEADVASLRLNFSNAGPDRIGEGLRRLSAALSE